MANSKDVKVYSTTWCAFCHQAKEYFKSKDVSFKDINVEEDQAAAKEMIEKTHQMGVPVIEIGDTIIIGYDRPKIDAALAKAGLV
jgi:glutaredoxin 3